MSARSNLLPRSAVIALCAIALAGGCAPVAREMRTAVVTTPEAGRGAEPAAPPTPRPEPREASTAASGPPVGDAQRGGGGADAGRCPGEEPAGFLSPEEIMVVVRRNAAGIRECYEVERERDTELRGRITISWRINCDGSVASSRVLSSTMGSAVVEDCLVRRVLDWRFPEPRGGLVDVTFPFLFGTMEDQPD